MEQLTKQTKGKIIRFSIVLFSLLIIILILAEVMSLILPGLIAIIERGDEHEIEDYILSFGSLKGAMIATFIQFAQIISIVLPGAPVQIATGIIFGLWKGLLICQAGYLSAYDAVFFFLRKLHTKLDILFEPEAADNKKVFKFFKKTDSPEIMVMIACMIPIMPNGAVPYVASKTKISFKKFMFFSYVGSLPTLLLLCSIGENLLQGDYLTAGIVVLLLGGLIAYVLFNKGKVLEFAEMLNSKLCKITHKAKG